MLRLSGMALGLDHSRCIFQIFSYNYIDKYIVINFFLKKLTILRLNRKEESMDTLMLSNTEVAELNAALAQLEQEFGSEYIFMPEVSTFSCKCSGPAQSCAWH